MNRIHAVLVLGILWVLSGSVLAEEAHDSTLVQAQKAYDQGQFQQVVDLVKPLHKESSPLLQASRLYILALSSLVKTPEAIEAYDKAVDRANRDDEPLLRQMAIASILPVRSDMREQMRGAAYTALKEIESDNAVEYLGKGLTDETGMIRALVAEALGQREAGRRS